MYFLNNLINKHSVSMKSCKRFSYVSTFSDSNSFMMVDPG